MSAATAPLHATLVARVSGGRRQGVLLLGASGSGKSDLALRLISRGFGLVADDQVVLWRSGGRLFGRAPEPLSGLIEARGVGILTAPALPFAEVRLALDLLPPETPPERLPSAASIRLQGVEVAKLALCPFEASTPEKIETWLRLKVV